MFSPRFHNKEAQAEYKKIAKKDLAGVSTRKIDTELERSAALDYLKTAKLDSHDLSIFIENGNLNPQSVVDSVRRVESNEYDIDTSISGEILLEGEEQNTETENDAKKSENVETPKIKPKKQRRYQKFHSPIAQEMYDFIAKQENALKSGDKKIDTEQERQMLINYIYNNHTLKDEDKLDSHDLALLLKLAGVDSQTLKEKLPLLIDDIYHIQEVPSSATLVVENDKLTIINQSEEEIDESEEINESEEVQEDEELDEDISDEEISKEEISEEDIPTKEYTVQAGDYWYKMVSEQYNITSPNDINAIVRQLKDSYWEENKETLIQQGYRSSKDGFFPKAKSVINLPRNIEIGGKNYELL